MRLIKGHRIATVVILGVWGRVPEDADSTLPRLLEQFNDGAVYHGVSLARAAITKYHGLHLFQQP